MTELEEAGNQEEYFVEQRIMLIARTVNSEARKGSKERERERGEKLLQDFHKEDGTWKRKKFDIKISSRVAYVSCTLRDDFSRNSSVVMQGGREEVYFDKFPWDYSCQRTNCQIWRSRFLRKGFLTNPSAITAKLRRGRRRRDRLGRVPTSERGHCTLHTPPFCASPEFPLRTSAVPSVVDASCIKAMCTYVPARTARNTPGAFSLL